MSYFSDTRQFELLSAYFKSGRLVEQGEGGKGDGIKDYTADRKACHIEDRQQNET